MAATVALLASLLAAPAAQAAEHVGIGTQKWVVVLCHFSDESAEPKSQSYFEHMFTSAGEGELGEFDFWHEVSFEQYSIAGTKVTPWVVAKNPENTSESLTRGQWIKLEKPFPGPGGGPRGDKILACADGASGVNWSEYWGVIAIFPEARSTLAKPISASVTEAELTTTENFPNGSAPFLMTICSKCSGKETNYETVEVTAVSGNTVTIKRGQEGTTANEYPAGAQVGVPGDLGGVGWGGHEGQGENLPIQGKNYTISTTILPHEIDDEGASHEMGHASGFNHSRAMSSSTTDYNDCFDIMSAYSCDAAFTGVGANFGGEGLYNTVLGGAQYSKGPGEDAINLDKQGWIPSGLHDEFENSVSKQETVSLHALEDYTHALTPPAGQYLEARIPAEVTIQNEAPTNGAPTKPPTCSGSGFHCVKSKYYTVEYREKAGWDRGFPGSSVLLHLWSPEDERGYWVNETPSAHGGLLFAGDEYVDAASKAYVAVNAISTGSRTAQVTLGSRKIEATLTNLAPSSGEFNDSVTLSADLTVKGSGAPVPGEAVTLTVGSQSCVATTNEMGQGSCELTLEQGPGSSKLSASFTGDAAYAEATAEVPFTIEQEESKVTYTGATTSDYHDAFTASAKLEDPEGGVPIEGKTITFTLGVGDSCQAKTNGAGEASCSITPTQKAGPYTITASFGPDADYESSTDPKPFTITKEQTTTTYTGPTVILKGGGGVTLKGQLLEDGKVPIEGRTLTLSIGAQSCTGKTDASGTAECTLIFVGELGPQPLEASFGGDEYYLPSSDASKTATVFSFPSRGDFALGDATVDGAPPGLFVTWWSAGWSDENSLSGGFAPLAFKGFVANVALPTSTPPAACAGPWTTPAGDSPSPPGSVPSYMGVLVSSSESKSGATISGGTTHIVVVKTDPGYAPDPGHHGTGTIVATYC
jgi:hypothetical protein